MLFLVELAVAVAVKQWQQSHFHFFRDGWKKKMMMTTTKKKKKKKKERM